MAKSLRAAPKMRPLGVAWLANGTTMRCASRLDWPHLGRQRQHHRKCEQALTTETTPAGHRYGAA